MTDIPKGDRQKYHMLEQLGDFSNQIRFSSEYIESNEWESLAKAHELLFKVRNDVRDRKDSPIEKVVNVAYELQKAFNEGNLGGNDTPLAKELQKAIKEYEIGVE